MVLITVWWFPFGEWPWKSCKKALKSLKSIIIDIIVIFFSCHAILLKIYWFNQQYLIPLCKQFHVYNPSIYKVKVSFVAYGFICTINILRNVHGLFFIRHTGRSLLRICVNQPCYCNMCHWFVFWSFFY